MCLSISVVDLYLAACRTFWPCRIQIRNNLKGSRSGLDTGSDLLDPNLCNFLKLGYSSKWSNSTLIKFTHFFSERLRWVTSGGGWKRKEEERKGGKSEKQVVGGGEKGVGIADGEQRKGDKDARGGGGEGELPGRDPGRRGGSYL